MECKFAVLDELPEALYVPVITHTHGELLSRVHGILKWRQALLQGQLPEETKLEWPEVLIKRQILLRLEALDIVQYCNQQETLTDEVLISVLEGISSVEDFNHKRGNPEDSIDKLAQRQKIRDRDSTIAEHLETQWQELAAQWHELSETLTELGAFLGRGWDLSQGILASQGWRDIVRYRKLIKQLPYLQRLVAMLGRLREINSSEKISSALCRLMPEAKETITPYAVNEMGGIQRSDAISRLLPSELALLGHPRLKTLWYAKRAEKTLLTYQLRGLDVEIELKEQPEEQIEEQSTDLGYGPIIICLDTSASMHGEAEYIAKALTLEALRIAQIEQRACYVYAFSGPEQILEHELNLDRGGVLALLDFLQQSFQGGTDVSQALLRALAKQSTAQWQNADILLISDGRFPSQTDLAQRIALAKQQQGLRVHGVLLGNWQGKAMMDFCEPVHRIELK
jgi:uncharacterized protein with von Willebrand factor type A (vWA) domain